MKWIDNLAKRFVKSATNEVAIELEEVKKAIFDGLPVLVSIGVLVYTWTAFRSSPKKAVESGATVIQHLYFGNTINIHH